MPPAAHFKSCDTVPCIKHLAGKSISDWKNN